MTVSLDIYTPAVIEAIKAAPPHVAIYCDPSDGELNYFEDGRERDCWPGDGAGYGVWNRDDDYPDEDRAEHRRQSWTLIRPADTPAGTLHVAVVSRDNAFEFAVADDTGFSRWSTREPQWARHERDSRPRLHGFTELYSSASSGVAADSPTGNRGPIPSTDTPSEGGTVTETARRTTSWGAPIPERATVTEQGWALNGSGGVVKDAPFRICRGPACRTPSERIGSGWSCSLERDHEGPHVALWDNHEALAEWVTTGSFWSGRETPATPTERSTVPPTLTDTSTPPEGYISADRVRDALLAFSERRGYTSEILEGLRNLGIDPSGSSRARSFRATLRIEVPVELSGENWSSLDEYGVRTAFREHFNSTRVGEALSRYLNVSRLKDDSTAAGVRVTSTDDITAQVIGVVTAR